MTTRLPLACALLTLGLLGPSACDEGDVGDGDTAGSSSENPASDPPGSVGGTEDSGEEQTATGVITVTGDSTWSGTLEGRCSWFGEYPLVVSPVAIDLFSEDGTYDFFSSNPVVQTGITVGLGEVDAGAAFTIYTSTTETTTIERLPSGEVRVQATGTRLGLGSSTAEWTATVTGCVVEE